MFSIESRPLSNIVTVTYSGSATLDLRLQAVDEVCSNYSDLKPLKILVDVRELVMDMLFGEQEAF